MVTTRTGARMPPFGLGTWRMGESGRLRQAEVGALRLGLELGVRLIDTAEMYGSGEAERIVADALEGRRDEVFLVSKVLPQNASRAGTLAAAERSLKRLRTDHLDLYLLHWEGPHPIEDTLDAFVRLREQGKIRHYGVSNFDAPTLGEAVTAPGGDAIAADQVLYNLDRRAVEWDLLPWCRERDIAIMAYSPLEQGRLRRRRALDEVARRHGVTPMQVALAWTVRLPGVVTIPKATRPEHVREDVAAQELVLEEGDLAELDAVFPPPTRAAPLETL
jgi:diketogulonate reductase-like aldo/keto reductase